MAWHQHFTPNETTRLHSPSHLDLHAGDRLLHPRVVLGAPMERLWDKLKHEVEERLVLASGVVRGRVEKGDEVDDVRVSQLAHELELAVLKWSCQVFGASDRGKGNVRRTMNLGSSPTCQKARQSKPKWICELSAFDRQAGAASALSRQASAQPTFLMATSDPRSARPRSAMWSPGVEKTTKKDGDREEGESRVSPGTPLYPSFATVAWSHENERREQQALEVGKNGERSGGDDGCCTRDEERRAGGAGEEPRNGVGEGGGERG